jgi:long-chain fatty acid transport protein
MPNFSYNGKKDLTMRSSISLLTLSVGVIFATGTTQVMATGFALYLPDIGTMGTAYAGAAATANNASIIAANPAGMSRLTGNNITLNNTLIVASSDIKNASGTSAAPNNTNQGNMVPRILVGSAFVTFSDVLVDNMSVGLGLFAPHGLKTNHESTFQGRTFGDKSVVTVVTIQPTVSYAFTPNFSAGVGLDINHFNGILTSGVNQALPNTTKELNGAKNALGYNIGFLYSPTESTSLALAYHAKVDYKLNGNVIITNAPASPGVAFNATGKGKLTITTPDSIELAATYQITPSVNVKASITRTMWSTIESLAPVNTFTASGIQLSPPQSVAATAIITGGVLSNLNSSTSKEELNFKDVNMYSLGADWQVNDKLTLRTGVAYDASPVTTEHRGVRLPIANRMVYALGANYKLSESTNMDLGYNYLKESTARVKLASTTPGVGSYNAEYNNTASLIAAQLNYKF